jgi:hypothetical protein
MTPTNLIFVMVFTTAGQTSAEAGSMAACDLAISFGSYATGIDRQAEARVEDYLGDHPEIRVAAKSDYGREGEYTLCLAIEDESRTLVIERDLKALVGKSERAPTTVRRGNIKRP